MSTTSYFFAPFDYFIVAILRVTSKLSVQCAVIILPSSEVVSDGIFYPIHLKTGLSNAISL